METNEMAMPGMQIKKLFIKKYEPILEKFDLRPVEVDILVFLNRQRNCDTAKAIIQNMHLSKAHVSKSIDNLKSKELIILEEDEEDRRISHIYLTDKSNEVIDMATRACEECREIMQRGISSEELEVAKKILSKVIDNINLELDEKES